MQLTSNIFAKGFRPFFLLAAIFATAFLPLWLATYTGQLDLAAYWSAAIWHGHEMVFGFTMAVIAGFLLTAVGNWTRMETATGWSLAGLCGLWVAGRLAVLGAGWLPTGVVAAADLLFIPALAVAIGRPLMRTKNRRNFVFIGLMGLLFGANLIMHLSGMGASGMGVSFDGWERPALLFSLDVIVLIALIIGGRVIPMFTRNATAWSVKSHPWIERTVFATVFASLVLQLVAPTHISSAIVALVAGVAIFARMTHWATNRTWDKPILWVLHLGHAWIAVGFVMRAASLVWPQISASMAVHALTVGAIGMLTLGMMARVALGHTGRALKVAPPVAWAFVALSLAAVGRTVLPLLLPHYYVALVVISGVLWAVAFAVFLVVYLPILIKPRADGKEG
jgi:uncharacterized protein involved in response to NO